MFEYKVLVCEVVRKLLVLFKNSGNILFFKFICSVLVVGEGVDNIVM